MATKPMDVRDSGPVMSVVFFTSRFVPVVDEALRDAAAAGGWYGARGTALSSIFGNGSPYDVRFGWEVNAVLTAAAESIATGRGVAVHHLQSLTSASAGA